GAHSMERHQYTFHVSRTGRLEHGGAHFGCAWETSTIPAQVFAHGHKLYAVAQTLEVTGMLQGHLETVAYSNVQGRWRSGRQSCLLPRPGFGTKEPGIAEGATPDQYPMHTRFPDPLHRLRHRDQVAIPQYQRGGFVYELGGASDGIPIGLPPI